MLCWPFLCVTLHSFVFAIKTFSPLNINTEGDARIVACHFTKNSERTTEHVAICGFKGETCSIAVYFNQSEAQIQKAVKCDCWDIFTDTNKAYIPDYSLPIDSEDGGTVTGDNIVATLENGVLLKTSSNYKYIELDGVNDYIDMGDNSNNCLGNVELCPAGLTLSMWIFPIKLEDGRQWYFGTAKINRVRLVIRNESQILCVTVADTAHYWISLSYQLTSKWTLITVTWMKDGMLNVYIDGCLFETVGFIAKPNTHKSRQTVIGKSATAHKFYAGIMVDEFMFWEKVLKPGEVMTLYIKDH